MNAPICGGVCQDEHYVEFWARGEVETMVFYGHCKRCNSLVPAIRFPVFGKDGEFRKDEDGEREARALHESFAEFATTNQLTGDCEPSRKAYYWAWAKIAFGVDPDVVGLDFEFSEYCLKNKNSEGTNTFYTSYFAQKHAFSYGWDDRIKLKSVL